MFNKLKFLLDGDLKDKVIAIWGLSFKTETDDMREAPALVVIEKLIQAGEIINVYDPISMEETKHILGDSVNYCKDMYDATVDSDALALLTEWKQFRIPSWKVVKKAMKGNIIVDGRNIYEPDEVENEGFVYSGIGKQRK